MRHDAALLLLLIVELPRLFIRGTSPQTLSIGWHNRLDEMSIVDRHRCHMSAKFGVFVDDDHSKLPTLYWLPKLHKRPYKSK